MEKELNDIEERFYNWIQHRLSKYKDDFGHPLHERGKRVALYVKTYDTSKSAVFVALGMDLLIYSSTLPLEIMNVLKNAFCFPNNQALFIKDGILAMRPAYGPDSIASLKDDFRSVLENDRIGKLKKEYQTVHLAKRLDDFDQLSERLGASMECSEFCRKKALEVMDLLSKSHKANLDIHSRCYRQYNRLLK